MKIRLAILEKDSNYLERIVSAFYRKYTDKFEIYSFTEPEIALSTLDEAKIDVLLASDAFEVDVSKLPKRCGFAYFVDVADVNIIREQPAIYKFQKADFIYKQILSIYSENSSYSEVKVGEGACKIIAFMSSSGGVGSSTMAAACAKHFAAKGQRTLYLNLEKFGSSELFFSAEGQFDMSDIIFALKSKKANLSLKLESCIKQDISGVYFYSQPKIALDMLELGAEEVMQLISALESSDNFDYIILDLDFSMSEENIKILRRVHAITWVGDGSESSNSKICRAFFALQTLEQSAEFPITKRLALIYNKFSNKTGKSIDDEIGLKSLGGAPRYEHATIAQVLDQLAPMGMFDRIIG